MIQSGIRPRLDFSFLRRSLHCRVPIQNDDRIAWTAVTLRRFLASENLVWPDFQVLRYNSPVGRFL